MRAKALRCIQGIHWITHTLVPMTSHAQVRKGGNTGAMQCYRSDVRSLEAEMIKIQMLVVMERLLYSFLLHSFLTFDLDRAKTFA